MRADQPHILVIEDEPSMRSFLADVLRGEGYLVDEAGDGDAGLASARGVEYAMVVTDLKMPGLSGLGLVNALCALPDAPEVVVLTAYGSVSLAVEAMKAGALDFMEKPLSGPDQVRLLARKTLDRRRLAQDNERLRSAGRSVSPGVLFHDPAMVALIERLRKVAATDATVLVEGESGSGKEVVARELHRMRFGDAAPFTALNCSAVPENLLESELFGHERGAFTGAGERKLGLLEAASSGTMFLDEIGEMPLALQPKLLRVIETREFTRVGGVRVLATSARFVAATNQDLAASVAAGRFRQDLFFRLNVFPVLVPPLRERPGDLAVLAAHFVSVARAKLGRPGLSLGTSAMEAIERYDWPGNVRELRNAIERACILAESDEIETSDLGLPTAIAGASGNGLLADMERQAIVKTLDECGGNRRLTAQKLGISLRTLQYRLKEYGLVDGR
jgi:DNA-binding NtrC family response regulator